MKVGILFKKREIHEVEVTIDEHAGFDDLGLVVEAEQKKLGDGWEFETWWHVTEDTK